MTPPHRDLGPYRLLRRIGSGGMAEVYLAERIGEEGFSRTVAIKTIATQGAAGEAMGLFLDEARVAAYLDHPAIVQTVDLGYENETLFIAMEYVAGPPLSRIIKELRKRQQFLAGPVVALVGARVASALDYAYGRATAPDGQRLEMIHRDVSPQNILLTRGGSIKLTDFGVARASIQTHRTRTGQVRGKAAYMAPEQVRAKTLDGRTDIFGLGLVLYEALTNVRAYQRKTDINSMRAILTDAVKPIHSINPHVPGDLCTVIMRALEKNPDDRWPSAQAFERALLDTLKISTAEVESKITQIIDGLFGRPDTYAAEEGRPVEAWQPTIAADAQAVVPKLPSGPLTPEMQRMLEPNTAAKPISQPTPTPIPTRPTANTERSRLSTLTDHRSLAGIGLPVLGVLTIVVAGLGVMLWKDGNHPPADPTPTTIAEPTPVEVRPAPVRIPPPPRPKAAVEPKPSNETRRRAKKKRDVAPAPAPPVEAPKPTDPPDAASFQKRVHAAAAAHEQRGNKDLAQSLRSLLFTLSLRPPTTTEQKQLRTAERALRN